MAKYEARIMYATPTPGLAEVEPSTLYNPSVVSGVGVVQDPAELYGDMHKYLAAEGEYLAMPTDTLPRTSAWLLTASEWLDTPIIRWMEVLEDMHQRLAAEGAWLAVMHSMTTCCL